MRIYVGLVLGVLFYNISIINVFGDIPPDGSFVFPQTNPPATGPSTIFPVSPMGPATEASPATPVVTPAVAPVTPVVVKAPAKTLPLPKQADSAKKPAKQNESVLPDSPESKPSTSAPEPKESEPKQQPKTAEPKESPKMAEPKESEPKQQPKVAHEPEPKKTVSEPKIAPKAPEPVKPVSHDESTSGATLQISEDTSSGLDTINIDAGGNWLEKRKWFVSAQELFGEIRALTEKAESLRVDFVDAHNAMGKKIDDFYSVVSFDKGELETMLKDNLEQLDRQEARRGHDLSDAERSVKQSLKNAQKEIEQLGNDIEKVAQFDAQITKTVDQAFKTIANCRDLEDKSWADFKDIGDELNDKKARSLYYEMENAKKNIEQNVHYLQQTLLPYLESKLKPMAGQLIKNITDSVKKLEANGVHLTSLMKKTELSDRALEQERIKNQEKNAEQSWQDEHEQATAKKHKRIKHGDQAWYVSAWEVCVDFFKEAYCFVVGGIKYSICKISDFFCCVPDWLARGKDFFAHLFKEIGCFFKAMWCKFF